MEEVRAELAVVASGSEIGDEDDEDKSGEEEDEDEEVEEAEDEDEEEEERETSVAADKASTAVIQHKNRPYWLYCARIEQSQNQIWSNV